MRKLLLAVGGLALLGLGYALAQTVIYSQVSGNECWSAGQGPGGSSAYLCLNLARGGTSASVLTSVPASFTIGGAPTPPSQPTS